MVKSSKKTLEVSFVRICTSAASFLHRIIDCGGARVASGEALRE
jgi:hypothetical protein